MNGWSLMRPGWVRLGFNYFFDEAMITYITEAILFLADHGLHFLADYEADASAGVWRCKGMVADRASGLALFWQAETEQLAEKGKEMADYLSIARQLAAKRDLPQLSKTTIFQPSYEALRAFWMPQDIVVS